MKIFSCQSWFSFDVSAQEICKGYPDDDAMEEIVDEEVFLEPEQEVEVAVETDEVEEKPAVVDDVVVDSIEVDYEKDAVEDVAAAEGTDSDAAETGSQNRIPNWPQHSDGIADAAGA